MIVKLWFKLERVFNLYSVGQYNVIIMSLAIIYSSYLNKYVFNLLFIFTKDIVSLTFLTELTEYIQDLL